MLLQDCRCWDRLSSLLSRSWFIPRLASAGSVIAIVGSALFARCIFARFCSLFDGLRVRQRVLMLARAAAPERCIGLALLILSGRDETHHFIAGPAARLK